MRNFLALLIVLTVATVAPASAQKTTKKPAAQSLQSAVTQVDGITNRLIDNLWAYTDVYFHDGDYNRIIGLCRILVEADPSFNDAYENASYLIWSQGDVAGADRFLQYGLSRTKDKLTLLVEFGRHLNGTKRYAEAEPYLKQAVELPNAGPVAYSQLGLSQEKQGKHTDALKTFETLVKKYPNFPSAQKRLDDARRNAATQGT